VKSFSAATLISRSDAPYDPKTRRNERRRYARIASLIPSPPKTAVTSYADQSISIVSTTCFRNGG
jgi:hypothetical protein